MCTKSLFSSQLVTLMIIIARSPWNRSLHHQLRYHIATTEGRGKNPKNLILTSSLHHRGITGTCVFYFWFWMLKSQSLHTSSLKKNWHQVYEWSTSTCIKQVITKPSNTVVLCYLVLNAFFVGSFSEINLASVKIIILNDFLWSWTGFELDIETYHFNCLLEFSNTWPPELSKNKTPNWILDAGDQF